MADEIQELKESVEIIQSLSTYPNREDGLTEEQMKEKFDTGAMILKQYLNDTVVPAIRKLQRALGTGEEIGIDGTLSKIGWAAEAAAVGTALAGKLSAVESNEHPGCYYRMNGEEREWLNPPMAIGVEYRTAEKYNGYPVYVKRLKMDSLPKAAEQHKELNLGISNVTLLNVDCFVRGTSTMFKMPYINSSGTANVWCITRKWSETNYQVQIWVDNEDYNAYSADFTIKYIKEAQV